MADVIDIWGSLPRESIPLAVLSNGGIGPDEVQLITSPLFSKQYMTYEGVVTREIVETREYTTYTSINPNNAIPYPAADSANKSTIDGWSITAGSPYFQRLWFKADQLIDLGFRHDYVFGIDNGGSLTTSLQRYKTGTRDSAPYTINLSTSGTFDVTADTDYVLIGYFLIEPLVTTGYTSVAVPGDYDDSLIEAVISVFPANSTNPVAQDLTVVKNRSADNRYGDFSYLYDSNWTDTYSTLISNGTLPVPNISDFWNSPLVAHQFTGPLIRRLVLGKINTGTNGAKAAVSITISSPRLTLLSLHLVPVQTAAWYFANPQYDNRQGTIYTDGALTGDYRNILQVFYYGLGQFGFISGRDGKPSNQPLLTSAPVHLQWYDQVGGYQGTLRGLWYGNTTFILDIKPYTEDLSSANPTSAAFALDRFNSPSICLSGLPNGFSEYLPTQYPILYVQGMSYSRSLTVSRYPGAVPINHGYFSDPFPVEVGAKYYACVRADIQLMTQPNDAGVRPTTDRYGRPVNYTADMVLLVVEGLDKNGRVVETAFSSPLPYPDECFRSANSTSKKSALADHSDGFYLYLGQHITSSPYIRFTNPNVVQGRIGLRILQAYGKAESSPSTLTKWLPWPSTIEYRPEYVVMLEHAPGFGVRENLITDPELTGSTWNSGAVGWSVNNGLYNLNSMAAITSGTLNASTEAPGYTGYVTGKMYTYALGFGRGSRVIIDTTKAFTISGDYTQFSARLRVKLDNMWTLKKGPYVTVYIYDSTSNGRLLAVTREVGDVKGAIESAREQWKEIEFCLKPINNNELIRKKLGITTGNPTVYVRVVLDMDATADAGVFTGGQGIAVGMIQVTAVSPQYQKASTVIEEVVVGTTTEEKVNAVFNPTVEGITANENDDWVVRLSPGFLWRRYTTSESDPPDSFPRARIGTGKTVDLLYCITPYMRGPISQVSMRTPILYNTPSVTIRERLKVNDGTVRTSEPVLKVIQGSSSGATVTTGFIFNALDTLVRLPSQLSSAGSIELVYEAYYPYVNYTGFVAPGVSEDEYVTVPFIINPFSGGFIGEYNQATRQVGLYNDAQVLSSRGVTIYLQPYSATVTGSDGTVSTYFNQSVSLLRHRLGIVADDYLPDEPSSLVVTRVVLPSLSDPLRVRVIDVRKRGGGLQSIGDVEMKLRSLFWDLSGYDGETPGAGHVVVRLPASILSGDGWSFSREYVEQIVRKYIPAGITFEVEYV